MHLGKPANKKTILIMRGVLIALGVVFIIAFRTEVGGVISLFGSLIKMALNFPDVKVDTEVLHSLGIILFNIFFSGGLFFLLWLFLISAQALLPVSNIQEVLRTAWHLWLYIIGRHGPAVFVKDGVENTTQEDIKRRGHGVVVVDFNSAVVLEDREPPTGFSRLAYFFELNLLYLLGLCDQPVSPRAHGAGIVFTRPGERIRGVVDLRKQFRVELKVPSYTREGIEVAANLPSIFTVGKDPEPDALQVTYDGDQRPENLRVCTFKPVPGGKQYLRLTDLSDDLDEADRKEIDHDYRVIRRTGGMYNYSPLPKHPLAPVFNPDRVFAAVFAQARRGSQETILWTDLPTRVSASFYREILPKINYDELYDIKGNGPFPLPKYKRSLGSRMRNEGVLAYRLVFTRSGQPLAKNEVYHEADLTVSEIRSLTNSKLLRDRGIKVMFAGFGDPTPVSPLVYKQRLDSWRANWERELDITQAGRDLQAMRTRSRALTEAQQDLWSCLSQMFSVQGNSNEALAMQVMQALEAASADPRTRQLLPANTIALMQHIHALLLPEEVQA